MNLDELSPFERAGKAHVDAWDQLNDLAKEEYRAFWNEALEAENAALTTFYRAWERCEGNRGCYSCCEEHDSRCKSQWAEPQQCSCGRDELTHFTASRRRTKEKPMPELLTPGEIELIYSDPQSLSWSAGISIECHRIAATLRAQAEVIDALADALRMMPNSACSHIEPSPWCRGCAATRALARAKALRGEGVKG